MAQFLRSEKVNCGCLRQFLLETSERVKAHARRMADEAGRPYIYLSGGGVRIEEHARRLAERDGIRTGPICVFAKLEPCNTFSFRYRTEDACVNLAKRKCLHFYYYFKEPRARFAARQGRRARVLDALARERFPLSRAGVPLIH
jgi:hypothetical protein